MLCAACRPPAFLALPLAVLVTRSLGDGSAGFGGASPDSAAAEAGTPARLRGSARPGAQESPRALGAAGATALDAYTIENVDPDELRETYRSECGPTIRGAPTLEVKWLSARFPCEEARRSVNVWKPVAQHHKWKIIWGGVHSEPLRPNQSYYYIESTEASNCADKYLRSSEGGSNPCPYALFPSSDQPVLGPRRERWIFEPVHNDGPGVYRILSLTRQKHNCERIYLGRYSKCDDVLNFQTAREDYSKQKWRLEGPLPATTTVTTTTTPGCVPTKVRAKWEDAGKYASGSQQFTTRFGTSVSNSDTTTSAWERAVASSFSYGLALNTVSGHEWSVTVSGELRESMQKAFDRATEKSREEEYKVSLPAGQIWKWTYYFDDSCGKGSTMVEALVSTKNLAQKPCCLPGHAADPKEQHGKCINSTGLSAPVCFCSEEICSGS